MDGISKNTFEQMDINSKLSVLFDYAVDTHKKANGAREDFEILKDKINKGRRIDTTVAATTGFLGGMIAVIGQFMFGWNK